MLNIMSRKVAVCLVCTYLFPFVAQALVLVNATPEPTPLAALSDLINEVATAMVSGNVSAAVTAIASSAALRQGSESALAQTIEFSISEAETLYAASNQSGITLFLLGAPYHPYNSSAAAARAEVLGQALLRSSTPSAFTGQSFADAFTQSFQTQDGPLQLVYGGFTTAAGSLLAANAANQSQAFGQMMLQAKSQGVQVSNVSSVLSQVIAFLPDNGSAAINAANQVYGATVQSLDKAAGNTTALAELILASIALDPHAAEVNLAILSGNNTEQLYGVGYDTTNATVTRIAGAILGSNLTSDVTSQVLASVIAQGLESGTRGAAAIAIEAAVYSDHYEAVSQGFAQAKDQNVAGSDASASQVVAQAHSAKAGQIASDAIAAAWANHL